MNKIRNLIEVPPVKTVIQLKDTEQENLRSLLVENFLITDEVGLFLKSFFSSLLKNNGQGYFVEGNFGSGKSHLLSVLSLLLQYKESWEPVKKQSKQMQSLMEEASAGIDPEKFLVVNVSLVEHSGKEYLEDIIIRQIQKAFREKGLRGTEFSPEQKFIKRIRSMLEKNYTSDLEEFLQEKSLSGEELFARENAPLLEELLDRLDLPYRLKYDRSEIFSRIKAFMEQEGYQGLVILIDELSEFLRSKSDGRRFNEDIRFLQFLGEFSQGEPVWIIATLQEEIEKTGETTPEAFNKIKDRFPFRFRLTGSHIKELIRERLIKIKSGAEEEIQKIYQFYKNSFTSLNIEEKDFVQLYPVHPLTIELLDNLKPLFSQHRGIIDFIHFRLQGDTGRNIQPFLDRESYNLLTPDTIFDHFQERIREMMETSPYYEQVFNYYNQEIDNILPPEDRDTGLALIKLLILFRVSPLKKNYTVEDMANMLLHQVTDLDPEVNYQNIAQILDQLYQKGAYLERTEAENSARTHYYIDLKADTNLILERKVEYTKSTIFQEDHRLFSQLGKIVNHRSLPLGELLEAPWTQRSCVWQNTERKGYFYLISFEDLTPQKLQELSGLLDKREEDYIIIMGNARKTEEERKHLKQVILPELREKDLDSFAFWIPEEIEEPEFLREMLARLILFNEYREDESESGREIKEALSGQLRRDKEKLITLFLEAYMQGNIISGDGESLIDPKETGYLPWENILEKIAFRLLNRRFPQHIKIAPFEQYLNKAQIKNLEEKFLKPGEISLEDAQSTGLNRVIDGFLKPMDLIAKKQKNWRLQIKPEKNPLLQAMFENLEEERTDLRELYWKMRKGSYGLKEQQFNLLILSLLYTGYLTAYGESKKISIKNLHYSHLPRIKAVGYGEIIDEEFQEVLGYCSLIPSKLRNQPFSLPLQQEIWDHLSEEKRKKETEIENLLYKIRDLEEKRLVPFKTIEKIKSHLNRIAGLLEEIKVSYSSEEGLERFASAYRNQPYIEKSLEYSEGIKSFLQDNLDNYLRIYRYLNDSRLKIPSDSKYRELKVFYQNLTEMLADEAIIFEEKFWKEIEEKFSEFQRKYREIYTQEHQSKLGDERFKPFFEKKQTKSYRLLELLARIEMVSVKNDLIKADRIIGRALEKRCTQFANELLNHSPICPCGYNLGQEVELPSLKELQRVIDSGVKEYIESLQEKQNREKILKYLTRMEEVGEKKWTRPVKEILKIKIGEEGFLEKLEQNLNRNVIQRIDKALSGNIALVERDIDALYENLVERSFSPQQLEKIFRDWLEGGESLTDSNYIKVVSQKDRKEKNVPKKLDNFLERNYPEFIPARREMQEKFCLYLAQRAWEKTHQISFPDILTDEEAHLLPARDNEKRFLEDLQEEKEVFLEFQKELDEEIQNKNLTGEILDRIKNESLEDLAGALKREWISPVLMESILLQLIRKTEEGDVNAAIRGLEKEESTFFTDFEKLGLAWLKLERGFQEISRFSDDLNLNSWDLVYRESLGFLEKDYFLVEKLTNKLNLENRVPFGEKKRRLLNALKTVQKTFQTAFFNLERSNLKGDKKQTTDITNLLFNINPRLQKKMRAPENYIILMDGMRWDVWEEMWKELKRSLTLREIEKGSLIAYSPTNTETQLEKIKNAEYPGKIIPYSQLGTEKLKEKDIVKFDYIDDKVHTQKDNYLEFLEEILFQTRKNLLPFFQGISSPAGILLFSDHGFRINYSFQKERKYEDARYLHGGVSLEEVITPWVFMYKV